MKAIVLVAATIGVRAEFARIALKKGPPPGATIAKNEIAYYKHLHVKVPPRDDPLSREARTFFYTHQPNAEGKFPAPNPPPTPMPTPKPTASATANGTNAPTPLPPTPSPTIVMFPHYEGVKNSTQQVALTNLVSL